VNFVVPAEVMGIPAEEKPFPNKTSIELPTQNIAKRPDPIF
jgi:hypothetical protein